MDRRQLFRGIFCTAMAVLAYWAGQVFDYFCPESTVVLKPITGTLNVTLGPLTLNAQGRVTETLQL